VVVLYGVQQPGVSNESLTSCIDTVNALHRKALLPQLFALKFSYSSDG